MAEFKISRLRFTYTGVWATSTSYKKDDVVTYNGKMYSCLTPHTASVFNSDIANWTLIIDGKTWFGTWATSTSYDLGNIVSFNNAVYICTTAHTSAGATIDLTKFTTLATFVKWNNTWTAGTAYKVSDVVKYGGNVYIANTNHTSAAANLAIATSAITGNGATITFTFTVTQTDIPFVPQQTVTVTGVTPSSYNATFTVTSCTTTQLVVAGSTVDAYVSGGSIAGSNIGNLSGLEVDLAKWSLYDSGIEYKGAYAGGIRYKLNDVVRDGPSTYICTTAHTSNIIPAIDLTKFAVYVAGLDYANAWSNGNTYQSGDVVTYGGYSYLSLSYNNTANNPVTSTSNWSLFNQGFSMQGDWTGGTAYKVGSVVRKQSFLFVAVADNTSQDPLEYSATPTYVASGSSGTVVKVSSVTGITAGMIISGVGFTRGQVVDSVNSGATTVTLSEAPDSTPVDGQALSFIGPNKLYWSLLAPGTRFIGFWTTGSIYYIGDIVVRGNASYRCIQDHNTDHRPDLDTANTYWITYTLHTRTNILVNQGDIATTDGTTKSALAIGTNQYTVTSSGSAVTWNKMYTTNNVFYVGPNGLDDVTTNGKTWDQPFKTIAYAAGIVQTGLAYTTQANHLLNNKEFLVQEMYYGTLTNGSLSFSGSNYLSTSGSTGTAMSTGNFTWECWVYPTASVGYQTFIDSRLSPLTGGDTTGFFFGTDTGTLYPSFYTASSQLVSSIAMTLNAWNHVALTRNSGTVTLWVNGASGGTKVDSTNLTNQSVNFGGSATSSGLNLTGRLSNIRIVKGTAVYTGAFTPSTSPLTAITNTQLLLNTLQGTSYLLDASTNNFTLTNNGTVATSTSTPVTGSIVGQTKSIRDARLIVDAIAYDLARDGTSQSIASAFAYFSTTTAFINSAVAAEIPYFKSALNYLATLIGNVIVGPGTLVSTNQSNNSISQPAIYSQVGGYTANTTATAKSATLIGYITSSLAAQSTASLPAPNSGLTATIRVKTGTYSETLPITIPENCALEGDELRSVVVQPKVRVDTITTGSVGNNFIVTTTTGMYTGCPVQFISTDNNSGLPLSAFESSAVNQGQTYYVNGLSPTQFSVSSAPFGGTVSLAGGAIGLMRVVGGDALKNMFYVRNGSGIRNLTVTGLLGTLSTQNSYLTSRPTGGIYVSLDPGTSVNDTTAWIFRKSPYIQNVSTFGQGATGLKIDGSLHAGGNKSIVCNDFTQVISDGIGIWCTGSGALCEAVSVFSYYAHIGYLSEAGGKIRATNGNSSYGTYGVVAEGYDTTETPTTGNIYNRFNQVVPTAAFSSSTTAALIRYSYLNAGSNYVTPVTNFIKYSNNLLGASWTTDNLTLTQTQISPSGYADSWTLTGTSASTGTGYISQNISIVPSGATFSGISASSTTGGGSGATFNITVSATGYVVTLANGGGTSYTTSSVLTFNGSVFGGITGTNNLVVTLVTAPAGAVGTFTSAGTVPAGSLQNYTVSAYVKIGTAPSVDLTVTFSGSATRVSSINYNFATNTVTPSNASSGFLPTSYGVQNVNSGWFRIWFTTYDTTALNTTLQYQLFAKGTSTAATGYSYVYGTQVENSSTLGFYLTNLTTARYTAYADYTVVGNGSGVITVGDEVRSNGVFETRSLTDSNGIIGGTGYISASNSGQTGNTLGMTLAGADINLATNYIGMRLVISAGNGVGQYGYISSYNSTSKVATVVKESFVPGLVSSTTTGVFNLDSGVDLNTLYLNQPVQFLPNYYNTTVTATSQGTTSVTASTGGQTNTYTVGSTAALSVAMPVTFSGTLFGGIISGYTYYITNIIDSTTIQISTKLYGSTLFLNTGTGSMTLSYGSNNSYLTGSTTNMKATMPIQFTGSSLGGVSASTLYYVNDVIDSTTFTISSGLTSVTATATTVSSDGTRPNQLTVGNSAPMIPCTPIIFSGTVFGNIVSGTTYYISNIPDSTHITVSATVIRTVVTASSATEFTVASTSGFVVGNPIIFSGNVFGGITKEIVYYVQSINVNTTSFTISTTAGGGAIALSAASGYMNAKTTPASFSLITATGSMTGSSTGAKFTLTSSYGTMSAVFQSSLFGGITQGTTYYVYAINSGSPNNFSVTATSGGGSAITLTSGTGSMQLVEAGWDHVNPGQVIKPLLDTTTLYYIEPRVTYSAPPFTQTAKTLPTQGTAYTAIGYGNNTWLAVGTNSTVLAKSTDGSNWSSVTMPTSAAWTGIAYGAGYWVTVASGGTTAQYSNSDGSSWKASTLPVSGGWNSVAYGNGNFVTIDPTAYGTNVSYSSDFGKTWTLSSLAGDKVLTASGTAQLNTTTKKFGSSSLALDGSALTNISAASHADYGYGSGDFTVEMWVNGTSFSNAPGLFDQRSTASEIAILLDISISGMLRLYINGSYVITANTAISTGTWTHVAISRVSGTTRMFIGGTLQTTTYSDSNNYAAKPIVLGSYYTNSSYLTGYIDELRISKGTGRYTTTFTPATSEFTADSTTVLLAHFNGNNASTNFISSVVPTGITWSSVAYGGNIFVAITTGGTLASYSTDGGVTWSQATLPRSTTWSSVAYGNGRFVAVSSTSGTAAYSFDGATWYASLYSVAASKIAYGQGVFVALAQSSTTGYTTEDGQRWTVRTVTSSAYAGIAFGFATSINTGGFVSVAATTTGSLIGAGARAKSRPNVVTGGVPTTNMLEPGSNYTSTPTVAIFDPNQTISAVTQVRVANGALSSPTFVSRGTGYATANTYITVNGGGYADSYQSGLFVYVNNLTKAPRTGDDISITGDSSNIYKVTSISILNGTTTPSITALLGVSPSILPSVATDNGNSLIIRSQYSQVRLTNHDFLSIGYGDQLQSNYPGQPTTTILAAQKQATENNYGRVFYSSSDQDGNFAVGSLFGVQQSTGIVTISASQFGLTGLTALSLGGISVGSSSVIINLFSTDPTFVANADNIIPTQKAVKSYITSRLSQGGANTVTSNAVAGTVSIGGTNILTSTLATGVAGSTIKVPVTMNFNGPAGGIDGNMMAAAFFYKHFTHR